MGSEPKIDPENPEWTEADVAAASGPEALPPGMLATFPRTKVRPGQPAGSNKQAVSTRLDADVLEKFRATGPGWQSRINDALKRARV